jgi:hypothetical protein
VRSATAQLELEKDRDDVTRFAINLMEDDVIDKLTLRVIVAMMHGERAYRPQAVAQALVSFLVNHRQGRVSDPAAYIKRTVASQQERLYGKPRK